MSWTKTDVVYLKDKKCPYAHTRKSLLVKKNIVAVFNYLLKKYEHLEWQLYLIGDLKGNKIVITDYEIYPQLVRPAHTQWVEDGIPTSYIYEVKQKYPGRIVGNIHSHNIMSPEKSYEDEENALVEGDFGIIINNKKMARAWMKKKLPCSSFILLEIPVALEKTQREIGIDTTCIAPEESLIGSRKKRVKQSGGGVW